MKIRFKEKIIIKISVMLLLFNSSLILSQDIKFNIIKEISTMDEIHNELLIDDNISDSMKNVSEIIENKDRELINDRDENSELERKKETEETSMEDKIPISQEKIEAEDDDKKTENKVENTKFDESTTYALPKIEKKFSDVSSNKKNKENIDKKMPINKKEEPKEREKKEERFEEINDKTNRVTALGSAMGAVDLGSTPEKKIRFGAGVGNSSSSQAIAVGVGYAPTDRFRVNTKFSSSTNNMNNNSISVGASYDLDL